MKDPQNSQLHSESADESLMIRHHKQVNVVYTEISDAEIWKSFRNGDELAFNYIYRKYTPELYNYGFQISGNEPMTKDCIQMMFISLRRKRERLGDVQSIKSYLFKILYRDLLKMMREKSNLLFKSVDNFEKEFPVEVSHETKLINEEVSRERKQLLEEAINQLPSRQRQALLLFYREEFSYKQLCELMDFKDVRSARKVVYRAIASLKEKINL